MTLSPRTKFVLMFLLFTTPFAASYLAFFFWTPTETGNFGTLIRPVISLPPEPMQVTDAGDVSRELPAAGLRGKWLIVAHDSDGCGSDCTRKLYTMRQLRLVLGKEQGRVARVVLLDDDRLPAEATMREYAGTVWVAASRSAWRDKLAVPSEVGASHDAKDYLFAVDPMGNLFMRYPRDADIKRIAADFKRVLKASQASKDFEK